MHPYQDQVNRMWEIIKLRFRAQKDGYWLESISLSYVLLEIQLRLLLSSRAGTSGEPIPPETTDEKRYLRDLATVARNRGFIDKNIWTKIDDFNEGRIRAIHGLAQGKTSYEDLREIASRATGIMSDIQNRWL